MKGFPKIKELTSILSNGVSANTEAGSEQTRKALQYGNHSSLAEHMPAVWEKLFTDIQKNRVLVFEKSSAPQLEGVRVAPLGAVVTQKVRIINDYSFEPEAPRGTKGGVNRDTITEDIPSCLCGEALPSLLEEIVRLRVKYPNKRILLAKADVTEAFRNVRVSPEHAQKFCYIVDDILVADFRLTFGWKGSPGFWGLMSEAIRHAHCRTSAENAVLLPEGIAMMSHVKIVEPWEPGSPARVPRDANIRPSKGGSPSDPFFAVVYVDDFIKLKVQHSPTDTSALMASASLASDHVRLFGPSAEGDTPILAPHKSSDWNTTIDALGYTINTHTLQISVTQQKVEALRELLANSWPADRREARAQEVLSLAGKLWNMTFVVRAGRYFVWQLLRLTNLHTTEKRHKKVSRYVTLGPEFHGDLAFWRWALEHKVVDAGSSLCAPLFTHSHRVPSRHYFSDASLDAVGGYCPEIKVFWRYALEPTLATSLKTQSKNARARKICINLLELAGMCMTAWLVQMIVRDQPRQAGDPVLLRGDNASAVAWINRCGGAKNRRAGTLMRLLGRLEIRNKWCHVAKHIPGAENVLADGISRWPAERVHENVTRLTNEIGWRQQDIGPSGRNIFELLLQEHWPEGMVDETFWNLMNQATPTQGSPAG